MAASNFEEYRHPRKGEHLVIPEFMISQGEDAVPLLCELLESPRVRTRILAARKLREVGDSRAVQPLCRMLAEYSGPVSPWVAGIGRLFILGMMASIAGVLTIVMIALLGWAATLYGGRIAIAVAFGGLYLALGVFMVGEMFELRPIQRITTRWRDTAAKFSGHDLAVRSAVDALAAIAVRCPENSLQQSLPVLRKVSADPVRHNRKTREAATRAAARVQMSSAGCRRLPIAAAAPQLEAASLLIAAGASDPEA
jgi:hypothetical protein